MRECHNTFDGEVSMRMHKLIGTRHARNVRIHWIDCNRDLGGRSEERR
jgi:hypothetical protein